MKWTDTLVKEVAGLPGGVIIQTEDWRRARTALAITRAMRAYFLEHYRPRHPGENYRNYKKGRNRAFRRWLEHVHSLTGRTVS